MCIAAFALDIGPYAAVIISNRDEWLYRDALPMAWWPDTHILAGKDLSAGGTWLGLNREGRFALVTNIRGSSLDEKHYPNSRGKLPLAWLKGEQNGDEFADLLQKSGDDYAGFNILYGNLKEKALFHFNNQERIVSALGLGQIHGLSNASLNTPWPKLVRLKAALGQILVSEPALTASTQNAALLKALTDKTSYDESPLSAVNVEIDNFNGSGNAYGRRCTTVIFVERTGEIRVDEVQRSGQHAKFRWRL
jgi:uncharacterized protein with NRDE domain